VTPERLTRRERRALDRVAAKARARQPYVAPVIEAGQSAPPASLMIVTVSHDSWCPKLAGGLCRCRPDVVPRIVEDEAIA
jgi:hypothetical protein